MCLTVRKNAHFKIAKKDIVVYKVIEKVPFGLRTPFQLSPIAIGETYRESGINVTFREVNTGLHSFCRLRSAKKLCEKMILQNKSLWHVDKCEYMVVKCIIPKGSMYIKGRVNGEYFEKGYVSDALTYVKVI